MLGKIKGRRRRGQQRMRLDSITSSNSVSLSILREIVKDGEDWQSMGSQRVEHDLVTE